MVFSMPFGAQSKPPSFNMMFAYFKQQGYSDQLAAAEARKIMGDPRMAHVPPPPPMFVSPAPPTRTPTHTYITAQQYGKAANGYPLVSRPVPNSYAISTSIAPPVGHKIRGKTTIPLVLKKTPKGSKSNEVLHNEVHAIANKVQGLGYRGLEKTEASSPLEGVSKDQSEISRYFSMETKGYPKPAGIVAMDDRPTMEEINKWIQRLYARHAVGAHFKVYRGKISDYVEKVVGRHRQGSLTRKDLFIPTEDDIMARTQQIGGTQASITEGAKSDLAETQVTDSSGKSKSPEMLTQDTTAVMNNEIDSEDSSSRTRGNFNSDRRRKARRMGRFGAHSRRKEKDDTPCNGIQSTVVRTTQGQRIVGTSDALEKPYLRLTVEPNPATVRPEGTLKLSFRHVFDKFMKNRNYRYIEEQLRSIRQDIQVQHLRCSFVIKLYATNARLALVHGDLDQFNQCQTQLMQLRHHVKWPLIYKREFDCYSLLYLALQNMQMDILRYLKNAMHSEFKGTPHYRYAMTIRSALAEGNFVKYFSLASTTGIDAGQCIDAVYQEAFSTKEFSDEEGSSYQEDVLEDNEDITTPPFYSKFLFKMFEPHFRMNSLVDMTRTALSLSVETIANSLNISSIEECLSFIRSNKGIINENGLLDCKRSLQEFISSPLLRNKKI